ncbi:amiloride sensitive cation channel-like protein [Saccoglossus kowalevskii]|uniref:Amiloride sensitive cation channel-like protein n=2 Tax=Saccoglossus kowalevskii TaxID=10224 RepID=A0ABM0GH00_SACKO|nr:amiloride sensitive cation channel-like protein [Saccoglossus kowalevskii]
MADSTESMDYKFATSTTMHGVARVAENSRLSVRVIWIIVVLACIGVCVWQISLRFINYMEYNTNTEISINYPGRLEFPAVTFCNFNRYTYSLLNKYVNNSWNILLYLQLANTQQPVYHTEMLQHYGITLELLQRDLERKFPDGLDVENFTRAIGWQLNDFTLPLCQWRGHKCFPQNFTHTFTRFGNCYTFNGGDEYIDQRIPGAGHGLSVVLNIQQSEYTESLYGNIEAGIKFLVHPKEEPPQIGSQGYALHPGTRAFADIRQVRYISLEPPWGQCDNNAALDYFTSYSLSGCSLEYLKSLIYKDCGCRPLFIPGNEPVCSLNQSSTCVQQISAEWASNAPELPCTVPCNYTLYPTSLSYTTFPSTNVAEQFEILLDITLEDMRENYVYLDVYYSQIQYEQYKQTKAMTSSALLSDVGGQFGLFIGISVITFVEIIEYIAKKITRKCCRAEKSMKVNSYNGEPHSTRN